VPGLAENRDAIVGQIRDMEAGFAEYAERAIRAGGAAAEQIGAEAARVRDRIAELLESAGVAPGVREGGLTDPLIAALEEAKDVASGLDDLRTARDKGANTDVAEALSEPQLPSAFERLVEAISTATSAYRDFENQQRIVAAGAQGVLAQLQEEAAIETEALFGNLDEGELRGKLQEYATAYRAYIDQAFPAGVEEKQKAREAHESTLAGLLKATEGQLLNLADAQAKFAEAVESTKLSELREQVADSLEQMKGALSPVITAQQELKAATVNLELAERLGIITKTEVADLQMRMTQALADQLDPIGALLDEQEREIELSKLTGTALKDKILDYQIEDMVLQNLGKTMAELNDEERERIALYREQAIARRGARAAEAPTDSLKLELGIGSGELGPRAGAAASLAELGPDNGGISQGMNAVIQAQERLKAGLSTGPVQEFRDAFVGGLQEIAYTADNVAVVMGELAANQLKQLSAGIGKAAADAIVFGKDFEEGLKKVGQQIVHSVISSLINIGVQMVINKAIGSKLLAASTTETVASAAVITKAMTPAAVATTAATGGANTVTGGKGFAIMAAAIAGLILGMIVSRKDGGMVYGPGGPRADMVPAMLSNGEFVVNAAATKRNRALLEAINAGGMQGARYQSGGVVGETGASPAPIAINVKVNNETRVPIDIQQRVGARQDEIVLTVREALEGGALDDVLEPFGVNRIPR